MQVGITPFEAVKILVEAAQKAPMPWNEHQRVAQAAQALQTFVRETMQLLAQTKKDAMLVEEGTEEGAECTEE